MLIRRLASKLYKFYFKEEWSSDFPKAKEQLYVTASQRDILDYISEIPPGIGEEDFEGLNDYDKEDEDDKI